MKISKNVEPLQHILLTITRFEKQKSIFRSGINDIMSAIIGRKNDNRATNGNYPQKYAP